MFQDIHGEGLLPSSPSGVLKVVRMPLLTGQFGRSAVLKKFCLKNPSTVNRGQQDLSIVYRADDLNVLRNSSGVV